MKKVTLTIDGKKVTASAGEKILRVALDNDIYIPNLCAIEGKPEPSAACRLCFVEIEGEEEPVIACTREVEDGMVINTRGEKALNLARAGFELIMASHPVDCAHCATNRACELQNIARHLGCKLKTKRYRNILRDLPVDDSNPLFILDPNKCVLCGRCVWVCHQRQETALLGFAHRGFRRTITTFYSEPVGDRCQDCGECVKVCPTGALSFK
ncbi:MAG: 2Fe-2S iron-sulfur cluster-binding protein [Dehalococcoidia bacterium]|jgi:formate dehydrogenase major subunit/NADH-quinone oxidoreductase subunit G